MKRALVPLAEGFEEMEGVILIDVLRRAGIEVVVAGLSPGRCRGSRGIVVVPDRSLDDVTGPFDLIALPGGAGGAARLSGDPRLIELLVEQEASGRLLGAVCAAPTVLIRAGLVAGRRVTSHPSVRETLSAAGGVVVDERVVEDGNLVTSQGPGTTMEFVYRLVARLEGEAKVEELNLGILARGFPPIDEPG